MCTNVVLLATAKVRLTCAIYFTEDIKNVMDFFSLSGIDNPLSPYTVNKISFVLFILDVVKGFLSFLFIFGSFYKGFGNNV